MKQIIKYMTFAFLAATALVGCKERYVTYSDAEYVMFADTLATYPVQDTVEYFKIPVVSTVVRDYDRTYEGCCSKRISLFRLECWKW